MKCGRCARQRQYVNEYMHMGGGGKTGIKFRCYTRAYRVRAKRTATLSLRWWCLSQAHPSLRSTPL